MHLRKALLQAGTEIEEILKRQIRMQSANNVELGNGFGVAGSGGVESFIERHGVGAGRIFFTAEGAQTARGYANIRRIDMPVDVEIRLVAVHALADEISHPSHRENVASAIQSESVVGVEPLACKNFFVNRPQARIVRLKAVQRSHPFDDIAGVCGPPLGTWSGRSGSVATSNA